MGERLAELPTTLAPWERALVERFGTLNAMLLPEGCRSMVEPTTPNVHVFSIVFACLEGRDPLLADFRAFLWTVAGIEEVPADRLEGG